MNKDLKGRVFEIPENIIRHLNHYVTQQEGDNNGVKRARNLIETKKVNYGQLKRILHDIDNMDKINDDLKYNLCGGKLMEDWGWEMLKSDRDLIQSRKKSGERVRNITGMGKNQHNKSHSKKPSFLPPTNSLKSNSDTTSTSSIIPSVKIFEEINRIKEIIKDGR